MARRRRSIGDRLLGNAIQYQMRCASEQFALVLARQHDIAYADFYFRSMVETLKQTHEPAVFAPMRDRLTEIGIEDRYADEIIRDLKWTYCQDPNEIPF